MIRMFTRLATGMLLCWVVLFLHELVSSFHLRLDTDFTMRATSVIRRQLRFALNNPRVRSVLGQTCAPRGHVHFSTAIGSLPESREESHVPKQSSAENFVPSHVRFAKICNDFAEAVIKKQITSTHVPLLQPGELITLTLPAGLPLHGYIASENNDETSTVHGIDGSVHHNVPAARLCPSDKENGYTRLVLPEQAQWPTFFHPKQRGVMSPNLYLRRESIADRNRRAATLDSLRHRKRKRSVVWMGIEGIGKSTDFNHILLHLLENLGKQDWFDYVIYHIEWEGTVVFRRSRDDSEQIQVEGYKCVDKHDLKERLLQFPMDRTVLLHEVDELRKEQKYLELDFLPWNIRSDVLSSHSLPMLISLPTSNSDKVLDALRYALVENRYYVDMSSKKMVTTMLRDVVNHASDTELNRALIWNNFDVNESTNNTTADKQSILLQEFQRRQAIVGPIMRSILVHNVFSESQDTIHTPSKFLSVNNGVGVYDIPKVLQPFQAPHLRPEVILPDVWSSYEQACGIEEAPPSHSLDPKTERKYIYQLRLHTDYIAEQVRRGVQTADHLRSLHYPKKYDFQVLESYARGAQHENSLEMQSWQWHDGCGRSAKKSTALPVQQLPQWSQEYRHPDPVLAVAADKLDGQGLYVPHHNNNPVYHHLSIRHPEIDAEGKVVKMGTVYLVHCSDPFYRSNYVHTFEEEEVVNVLEGLSLHRVGVGSGGTGGSGGNGGCGDRYQVMLIGLTFEGALKKQAMVIRANGKTMSVAQWAGSKRAQRYASVGSVLVRAPVFPHLDPSTWAKWL